MIKLSSVRIRAGQFVLSDISFEVPDAAYAVIMGPTGIGKTTILEAICGLRQIESGRVVISGVDVTDWSPADRNLGYVPQDLALFPTYKVSEQLVFAMKLRRMSSEEQQDRSRMLADLLGISHLLNRTVKALSGGEAQRVALARALSFNPSALLLDEPLSALDSDTRDNAQNLLKTINQETGVTVLHVTHNQEEARALADCCIRLFVDEDSKRVTLNMAGTANENES